MKTDPSHHPQPPPCNLDEKPSCQIAANIHTLTYTLIAFCLVCFLFLIQGGERALMAEGKAKFPIANVDVDFGLFIVVGPAILLLLVVYLYMFLGAWSRCGRAEGREKIRCLFQFGSSAAWTAFVVIFVLLTPVILLLFIYSARAVPETAHQASAVATIGLIFLVFQLTQLQIALSRRVKGAVMVAFLVVIGAVGAVAWGGVPLYRLWPLKVSGAELSGMNFSFKDVLRGADAHKTNFRGSVFWQADLEELSAPKGNFQHANLAEANLTRADIGTADFTGAILTGAKLIDARLADAIFFRTQMQGVDFTATRLGTADDHSTADSAIFFNTDLRKATLRRSFERCIFFGTVFREADFTGARFSQAVFIGADLRGAQNLSTDQLADACGDLFTVWDRREFFLKTCEEDLLCEAQQKIYSKMGGRTDTLAKEIMDSLCPKRKNTR
jgi:uncharacterized protein YjbI with pentapeptide repeats